MLFIEKYGILFADLKVLASIFLKESIVSYM